MSNKSKIFTGNKPVNNPSRNDFDLSQSLAFSMRPSVLRPVYYLHTVPNSAFRIDCSDIVRTGALQTAAFLRGKQELDFYFVPYSQLYSRAYPIFFDREDKTTPLVSSLDGDTFPKVPLAMLYMYAALPLFFERYLRYVAPLINHSESFLGGVAGGFYDLTYLAKNFIMELTGEASENVPDFQIVSLLKSCFYVVPDFTRFTNNIEAFSFISNLVNTGDFVGSDCLKLLSSCGFPDYYSAFDLYLNEAFSSPDVQNAYTAALSSSSPLDFTTHFSEFNDDFLYQLRVRFLHFLSTLNDGEQVIFDLDSVTWSKYVNPYSLFAYQKIWRDFYRDQINDDSELYLYASSMDYDLSSLLQGFFLDFDNADNLNPLLTYLRPRLRMMKKDLSCGLFSSTQYGSAGASDYVDTIPGISNEVSDGLSSSSAVAIKYALAMQRYRQTLLRAGNRTKDLLMAEFCVRSRYVEDRYSHYLGSFDGELNLNKVAATAESESYSVGDLAGNVFSGLSGNSIEFTCNDFGVIIGVLSFIPDPMHNNFGLDPHNLKLESHDFFHDVFDNLGGVPVSSHNFSMFSFDVTQARTIVAEPFTLGFGPRYYEYKQKHDVVQDAFVTNGLVPSLSDVDGSLSIITNNGSASNYVVVRPVLQTLSLLKDRSYLTPTCMDTLFKAADTGEPDNDHFEVALQVNCTAILPMSVYGWI